MSADGDGSHASNEVTHEAGGFVKGVAIALVTQNKDPDGLCRVKVRFPWHSSPQESYWARIAVLMAGKDRGTVFLPEVGDEVLVAFEREDMRFPYVIGALWNGKEPPPEKNSDGKNDRRVIKSRSGHTLTFVDKEGQGEVALALCEGGKLTRNITLDKNGIELKDDKGNSVAIKSASGDVKITAKGKLTLEGAQVVVHGSGSLELKGDASASLRGGTVNIN